MGLLKKKREKEDLPVLPKLPSLPELPSLPKINSEEKHELHELPSFPNNNLGEKFTQNTIKDAIIGNEEEEEEFQGLPELPERVNMSMEQRNMSSPMPMQTQELIPNKDLEKIIPKKVVSQEPVFVQIDKFEEGMETFKKIKKNMQDIENLLKETKELKQKEEQELSLWESEIQEMKGQIENIDRDIFSKI